MKPYILSGLLLAGLAGCKKNDATPAPVDPLIGHWQAETLQILYYDATGKQIDDHTFQRASQLDVTAQAFTTTQEVNGQSTVTTQAYTRAGETLLIPTASPKYTYYARNLSATSFTFEYNETPVAGQPYTIQLVAYHK